MLVKCSSCGKKKALSPNNVKDINNYMCRECNLKSTKGKKKKSRVTYIPQLIELSKKLKKDI